MNIRTRDLDDNSHVVIKRKLTVTSLGNGSDALVKINGQSFILDETEIGDVVQALLNCGYKPYGRQLTLRYNEVVH